MTIGPVIRLVPSGEEEPPASLICPFCGSDGVTIEQVRECAPRGGFAHSPMDITFQDQAILEYKANCPRCRRSYRQSSPAKRLPRELRAAQPV